MVSIKTSVYVPGSGQLLDATHVATYETPGERAERIVSTYASALTELNELFGLLFEDVCGPCIGQMNDDAGCCGNWKARDTDIYGPAAERIIQLRREAGAEMDKLPDDNRSPCSYHDKRNGCNIPTLKSPVCASHFCAQYIPLAYGIDYCSSRVMHDLVAILNDVRAVDANEVFTLPDGETKKVVISGGKTEIGVSPGLVEGFHEYVDSMVQAARTATQWRKSRCEAR